MGTQTTLLHLRISHIYCLSQMHWWICEHASFCAGPLFTSRSKFYVIKSICRHKKKPQIRGCSRTQIPHEEMQEQWHDFKHSNGNSSKIFFPLLTLTLLQPILQLLIPTRNLIGHLKTGKTRMSPKHKNGSLIGNLLSLDLRLLITVRSDDSISDIKTRVWRHAT